MALSVHICHPGAPCWDSGQDDGGKACSGTPLGSPSSHCFPLRFLPPMKENFPWRVPEASRVGQWVIHGEVCRAAGAHDSQPVI